MPYGSSLIFSEAILTLSLVMRPSELNGAFPNAKLILCLRNSSSVTSFALEVSSIFVSSGSVSTSRRNCLRSAILFCLHCGGIIVRFPFALFYHLFSTEIYTLGDGRMNDGKVLWVASISRRFLGSLETPLPAENPRPSSAWTGPPQECLPTTWPRPSRCSFPLKWETLSRRIPGWGLSPRFGLGPL